MELSLRTVQSANQLSICGAVLSWCEDLADKIPGQTSSGVDGSSARMNGQSSKRLHPQRSGFLDTEPKEEVAGHSWHDHLRRFNLLDPDEQFRKFCESAGFIRCVSVGMRWNQWWRARWILEIEQDQAERKNISSCCSNFSGQALDEKMQKSDQLLKSRLSVILKLRELEFRSPPRLEMIPTMLGWSFPEVQTVTWKSYDAMIQFSLQEALKKLIVETFRKLMQNRQQSGLQCCLTTFQSAKGNVWTSLLMFTAIDSRKPISRNLFVIGLGRHEKRHDRQMEQYIGNC